jgi:hypothetical protein
MYMYMLDDIEILKGRCREKQVKIVENYLR